MEGAETKKSKPVEKLIARSLVAIMVLAVVIYVTLASYYLGFVKGTNKGSSETAKVCEEKIDEANEIIENLQKTAIIEVPESASPIKNNGISLVKDVSWGGPDLWSAVNNKRVELGVNQLEQKDDLCTIAAVRLNEQIELGKLDAHVGFSNIHTTRPDLAQIIDSYDKVAEYMAAGADSAEETVSLWENTLGHSKLLTSGEFEWGCIYAQNSFAVAIVAY